MSKVWKVAVVGAAGRMGSEAVKAVNTAPDMDLVVALGNGDSLDLLVDYGAEVMIDLTVPAATEANVHFAVENGIHAVVGTTGWTEERLAALEAKLAERPEVGVLIAPNFAIGSLLATEFAARAAKFFESVEVIEMHHPNKVDAPSGTAVHTAKKIGEARAAAGVPESPDATETDEGGSRGAKVAGVNVHAVRLRGLTAHQEILLGDAGQQLVIRHDSFDRTSFMPGVLLGVRQVAEHPGLTVGLDHYLDLS
ncbi:4-hydroxy-tetrahydrodipicolinate reductase [Rothia nasimurium]|uniref:4-hydroxy-tetrahydrodipicolinate reductase n=1 Tax=Rothia nasimurium TaxID=85336 RepID=UPI0023513D5D|nr:4-hydroxy-tetrahydrodipicolinate reductase [Rothia nasimurium]